jgi:hypothetical protein
MGEPRLSKGYTEYGAQMGRMGAKGDPDEALKFRVYQVHLDSGGYDNGGAYWGSGTPLFRALAEGVDQQVELYLRAEHRLAALQLVLDEYPKARFFRGPADSFGFAEFLQAYITAALWSSTDDSDVPLDSNYGPHSLAPETRAAMRADCRKFYDSHHAEWAPEWSDEQAGHDFWLTRNGHGVGFWDRDHGDKGDRLSEAARAFGEVYLHVGDNGRIYQ